MNGYPDAVEELMLFFKQLPGVGRRGAERMILAMLEWDKGEISSFAGALSRVAAEVTRCPECGNWASGGELCPICRNPGRDASRLCVVENVPQLLAVEKGGSYRGKYLVLGGKLSPLDGENGENLNSALLLERASDPEVKEVIIALSADVEGRATTAWLAELLKDCPVELSQPARGLPAGANLSFADGATVAAAFSGRVSLKS